MPEPITVPIPLADAPYEVRIGTELLGQLGAEARALFPKAKNCAIVTDSNVAPLYASQAQASLETAGFTVCLITVPAGEDSKSFAALEKVTREMIRAGLDRKAFLVALGGGVVGDLAGFAAAIHFRGIPYIQMPTTVLAQVDSSVGGKTGINTPEGKNLIGAFHQPKRVLADTATLASLPERAWREGFAEIIKHAAIRDAGMFDLIRQARHDRAIMPELIARNVRIKGEIVAADEYETKGLRALLNFGHTLGHAIESCAGNWDLLHGEAISIGMNAALWLSVKKSTLTEAEADEIRSLLADFHLPLRLPAAMSTEEILTKLSRDKKFDQGAIRFILLKRAGAAFVSDAVSVADLKEAIAAVR